jgi:tetratricopeptide (TPR) repeat protein
MQRLVSLLLLALLLVAPPLAAQTGGKPAQRKDRPTPPAALRGIDLVDTDPYTRCLERSAQAPLAAFNEAEAWRARGGGEAARHCAALAILNGGDPRLAAEELQSLADAMRLRPAPMRAQVLGQAARAWMMADDMPRAVAAASVAIGLSPGDLELRIDRAEFRAAAGDPRGALEDLEQVLARAPGRADALTMRAAAQRRMGALDLAARDVHRALELAPELPEAWLERGILERMAGRPDAARAAWIRVLAADPDGPSGDAARAQIEDLELGTRPPAAR